jgi:hemoglobin
MSTENIISNVVESFYAKARADILLGYQFAKIKDFETHIPRIIAFWEIQLLGKTDKEITSPFDLMNSHRPLNIKRGELDRWVILFQNTLKECEVETNLQVEWLKRIGYFREKLSRLLGP